MLKSIIIDDEIMAIEALAEDIKTYTEDIEIIATCSDSTKAKSMIEKLKPDILFLDIEMPGLNGFQLLESIDTIDFSVVFVTAYDQFALKAFEFSAADYLVKPVDRKRLVSTINTIKEKKAKDEIDCKFRTPDPKKTTRTYRIGN